MIQFFIGILATLVLPIRLMIFCLTRAKAAKAVILGVACFVISQELLRIPMLNHLLGKSASYIVFQYEHPVLHLVFLSVSAGVFEECGRWVFMRAGKTDDLWKGIAFGIGHGGIESVLVAGIGCLNIAFTYPSSVWPSITDYLLVSAERIFAMVFHVGLSVIVLIGRERRRSVFLLVAIILHTAIDFAGLYAARAGLGHWKNEAILAACATGVLVSSLLYYIKHCKRKGA